MEKTVGTIEQKHGDLGEFMILRTRQRLGTKKAGRFLIRVYEGPAKNLLL